MKAVIVCASVSHGNTKRIAEVMGKVLSAPVVQPEEIDPAELAAYDLVGLGSGIFSGRFHPSLRRFAGELPVGGHGRAFVFATSGLPEPPFRPFTRPLARRLEQKGFTVADAFSCRGYDTWLPFRLIGGINRTRPDSGDLAAAHAYAEALR
ncbi:flavodoxin family protein [Streptacidiphilus sp. MAP5-3]|uniref:flavodoxin family protein n=1 Tax=unclassified Streptacidiphilus TaxID=2643834 RepID=UPI00351179C1